ncbi:MAG: flagellar hook-basal body complex protein FliE [Phycisphaerales bacterium JB039]
MADPIGLIGAGGANPLQPGRAPAPAPETGGADFKDAFFRQLREVNKLQQETTAAIEDLAAGRRDDVEGVLMATQKADTAFRMLQGIRNKVMEAYEEVKQMRV